MMEVYPDAAMFDYANPMAVDAWMMYARYPHIKQVGLCHSAQGTVEELAHDLNIDLAVLRYRCVDINRMVLYLELECKTVDGSYMSLYPELLAAYEAGQAPKPNIHGSTCCQNIVRYEAFKKLGYFVTKSSGHFAEYTPRFIRPGCEDLTERYKVPLDEHPKRCVEQPANWHEELEEHENVSRIDIEPSRKYVSTITNAIWIGEPSAIYGNVHNDELTDNLSQGCRVEVACLVGASGIQPAKVGTLPLRLTTLMQTNIGIQTLLIEATLTENHDRVHHAAMMDPHTAAMLGIDEIYTLVDDLIAAHDD